ncbi:hypothetical protein INT47_003970 [Mucor saturninus]|uniref:Transcription activator GCR1-like domain-containing protein n=1 Tax=Mucor saturninus TaxID=64648 RepID=A0A8H7R7D4_9FUNG|nr:hypothetical protein INT47_003970 [Mucor saturninus]
MKTVLQHLFDISSGRAPLNINVHIPGDMRQPPVVATDFEAGPSTLISERLLPAVPSSALVRSRSNTTVGYRFAKALTLLILWREWFHGLSGNYSIVEMNRMEPDWYKTNQGSYYDRRCRILKKIQAYAVAKDIPDEVALHKAEQRRQDKKFSLDHLAKSIRLLYGDF